MKVISGCELGSVARSPSRMLPLFHWSTPLVDLMWRRGANAT